MAALKVICWALTFIITICFQAGKSIGYESTSNYCISFYSVDQSQPCESIQ